MIEQTSTAHRLMLTGEMMRTMTIPTAELESAYADLLNLAFEMVGDLATAEWRIHELEEELGHKPPE